MNAIKIQKILLSFRRKTTKFRKHADSRHHTAKETRKTARFDNIRVTIPPLFGGRVLVFNEK